jgi:branched-chain amino acid transport system permease protein
MDASIAWLLIQDGVTNGAAYALLALALVLVFSVTRVIFIPQGEFVTFGALTLATLQAGGVPATLYLLLALAAAVLAFEVARYWRGEPREPYSTIGWAVVAPLAAALVAWAWRPDSQFGQILLALLVVVPLGPLLYRLVYRPMAEASVLTLLMASMALHGVLVGLGLLFFGPEGFRTEPLAEAQGVIAVSTTCALVGLLFLGFRCTLAGKALRATAINRTGARLVGIPVQLSGELCFALAATIGAVSGILIAPITTLYYDTGFLIGLKGFVAAILGGLASYPLALCAALAVGLIESFSSFWASAYKEVLVFSLLVPVLWWRSRQVRHVEDGE